MKLLKSKLQKEEIARINAKSAIHKQISNYKPGNVAFESLLRVRPLFIQEQLKNPNIAIEAIDKDAILINSNSIKASANKIIKCTKVSPPGAKTSMLFQKEISQIASHAFSGEDQAMFIIGGKDSGKTHTFLGSTSDPGLCLLIPNILFTLKEKFFPNAKICMSCFSFESGFVDMLAFSKEILDHKVTFQGNFIPGLSAYEIEDLHETFSLLKTALIIDANRDINRDQSQSFTLFGNLPPRAILAVKFMVYMPETNDSEESVGSIYIIDTEAYDKVDGRGVNNAMLAFDNCLRAIYDSNLGIRDNNNVPYEQSAFTSFFKDYLGGIGKTYIIGTLSPFEAHIESSMRTLREIQWAFQSTSLAYDDAAKDKKESYPFNYTKSLQNIADKLSKEISNLASKDHAEDEEVHKQQQFLAMFLKKLFYAIRLCAQKQKQIIHQRDTIREVQIKIIDLEKAALKEHVKSSDLHGFFQVKVTPLSYNLVFTPIQKLQEVNLSFYFDKILDIMPRIRQIMVLSKKLKALKTDKIILSRMHKDFKDTTEKYLQSDVHQSENYYIEIARQFYKLANQHLNWTICSCFFSFNHPRPNNILKNRLKVERLVESIFHKILLELRVDDFDSYEDPTFVYAGISLLDKKLSSKQLNIAPEEAVQVDTPKSHNFEKGRLGLILNDISSVPPNQQLKENLNCIFTVPIDLQVKTTKQKCITFRNNDQNTKESLRNKIPYNKAFSFNSSNSSSDNISRNEIPLTSEMNINFTTKNEENSQQQLKFLKRVPELPPDNNINPSKKTDKDANNTSIRLIKPTEQYRYYDDEDPQNLYKLKKKKNKHSKQLIGSSSSIPRKQEETPQTTAPLIRLTPPSVDIKSTRTGLQISKKIKMCTSMLQLSGDKQQQLFPASTTKDKGNNDNTNTEDNTTRTKQRYSQQLASHQHHLPEEKRLYFENIRLSSEFNKNIVVDINLFKNDLKKYQPPASIAHIFHQTNSKTNTNNHSSQQLPQQQQQQYNSTQTDNTLFSMPNESSTFHSSPNLLTSVTQHHSKTFNPFVHSRKHSKSQVFQELSSLQQQQPLMIISNNNLLGSNKKINNNNNSWNSNNFKNNSTNNLQNHQNNSASKFHNQPIFVLPSTQKSFLNNALNLSDRSTLYAKSISALKQPSEYLSSARVSLPSFSTKSIHLASIISKNRHVGYKNVFQMKSQQRQEQSESKPFEQVPSNTQFENV